MPSGPTRDAVAGAQSRIVCSNCVMDTSDAGIRFDERGRCDYCNNFYANILPVWRPDDEKPDQLAAEAERIRAAGRRLSHDCLIGISGGVDSSYITYVATELMGLRPLLFHVDAGWNSQEAVHNVERLVDSLGVDLHTEVVNWQEMKDLQRAFFLAQVPHLDTPQDHAFFAGLYNFARKHGFRTILTGANYSTECVREPLEWHYHASDLRQIRDIHRRFGERELRTFPTASVFRFKIWDRLVHRVRVVKPLNMVRYRKDEAIALLRDRYGWQEYPHKHYESRFTRFYEGYWLPNKFGYDKRRAHFSSLVLTGQMARDEALDRLAEPPYDPELARQDFEYVATKLDWTVEELREIMAGPNRTYRDYRHSMGLMELGTAALRLLGIQRAVIR